jgi:hypothetical protein
MAAGEDMKWFPLLFIILTTASAQPSLGQTNSASVSTGKPSAKTQAKQDKKTSKTKVKPDKTSAKLATTPSQDAAYALTGPTKQTTPPK